MDTFFEAFAAVLSFFYSATHNYALSITLLTLVVMVVVTPLTLKGTRSMMVMQQMQPEMKKIQQRYKDDRQKLNEELLKFYKENNINPLGGCLPLVVQMPIFLILYQVLRGLTRRVSDLGFNTGWSVGQLSSGTTPTTPPSIARPFDPAFLDKSSEMYRNLNGNTVMASPPVNFDLAESARQAWSSGLVHALPYVILIVIVGVTGFIQQRQIQGRSQNAQVNPQQQMIMKIMPVFLPFISISLPAGLVLYFAVSNIYRIAQQSFISRSIYNAEASGEAPGDGTPRSSKSKMKKMLPSLRQDDVAEPSDGEQVGSTSKEKVKGTTDKSPKTRDPSTPVKAAGSKEKTGSTKGTTKADRGKSAPKKSQSQQKRKGPSGSKATPPALQPRARKNKKR